MSRKIGIIVEGQSDKIFFDKHFKKQFPAVNGMKVIPSATSGNQKIKNKRVLKSKIEDLKDHNCTEIYVLVDLDDNDCIVAFRDSFKSTMGLNSELNVIPVIVSTELESWMLSAWEKSDKKTKEDLQKKLNIKSSNNIEKVMIQKFIKLNQKINSDNNESLKYFLDKLGL